MGACSIGISRKVYMSVEVSLAGVAKSHVTEWST